MLTLAMLFAVTAPHPLVGVWRVTYPWHTEMRNGVVVPYQENGEVTVEMKGDSLIATVTTTRTSEFSPTRPFRLATIANGSEAVFVERSVVNFTTADGAVREATAVTTWVLRPAGDDLGGSLERYLEGADAKRTPRPVTGRRIRS